MKTSCFKTFCKDYGDDFFNHVVQNEPIWRSDSLFKYSVCSTYQFCLIEFVKNVILVVEGSWQTLWKLTVQLKVWSFMWSVVRNCLPIHIRLIENGVNIVAQCPWCSQCLETTKHLLMHCEKVCKFGSNFSRI